jgi:hypothetical protein
MDKTLRIAVPLALIAFASVMAYAVTIQLRIWHVWSW